MQQSDVTGRRVGAAIIDLGIVVVLVLVVGGLVGNDVPKGASASARFGALDRVLILGLIFAYYWGFEAIWGQTLGKRALGIRVARVDGSKASVGATFLRTLLRIVDGFPGIYIVGLISIFATGSRRQRVGDLAAKTRVVAADAPTDELPPAPPPPPSDDDVLAQIMR